MKTKEQKQQYNKEYYKKNRENLLKNMKEWKLKNPESMPNWRARNPNYQNNWNLNNKEKSLIIWRKAYKNNRLQSVVRSSTINRFKKETNCGICKSDNNLQFHHWRYQMPVESKHFSTLCSSCHNIQHRGIL